MPTTPVSGLPLRSLTVPPKRTRRGRADAACGEVWATVSETSDKSASSTHTMRSFMGISPSRKWNLGIPGDSDAWQKARNQALGGQRGGAPKNIAEDYVMELAACQYARNCMSDLHENRFSRAGEVE